MMTMACYSESRLKEYLAGWIDEPSSTEIETHLAECQACEQTVVGLEVEPDTLVACVRSSSNPPSKGLAGEGEPPASAMDAAKQLVGPPSSLLSQGASVAFPDSVSEDSPSSAAVSSATVSSPVAVSSLAAGGGSRADSEAAGDEKSMTPSRIGDYELLRPIGRGGMGAVFEARHTRLQKRVAIKLLPASAFRSDSFAARFEREMRAAGSLSHPAIVQATDAGECPQAHYLVMELVEGLDVSRLLRGTGEPLSIESASEVARQMALALSHAHEKGIVHRDIKPSNVMVSCDGDVKLLDFGLATAALWEGTTAELTTVGQLMGTLDYMAPEQAERPGSVDYRADLYSLGASLFRMLTQRTPLAASPTLSPLAKLRLLALHSPPSLATLRPDCPPALVRLVDGLLSKDPDDRPPSAAHVAESLDSFANAQQLSGLVAKAMQLDVQEDRPLDYESVGLASSELQSAGLALGVSGGASGGASRIWSRAVTATAFFALAIAGIIFTIDTRKGELVIESDVPGVQVTILQDGKANRELTLSTDPKTTRLFAGSYEVRLSEGSDRVEVIDGAFTLSRGQTKIARVRLRPSGGGDQGMVKNGKAGIRSATLTGLPASTDPLQPGDRLKLTSLVDDALNGRAVVQADLTVKFPLIGTVDATGMTVVDLSKRLSSLASEYVRNPALDLSREFVAGSSRLRFIPPASSVPVQPGDALLIDSVTDSSLDGRVIVLSDLTIQPKQLGTIGVEGKTVDQVQDLIQQEYRSLIKNPLMQVVRDFDAPNPRWQPDTDSVVQTFDPTSLQWGDAMYDGKLLGEWIELLARERSYERVAEAISAIQATYDPGAAELVERAAIASLRYTPGHEMLLADLFHKIAGSNERYFELLREELERSECSTEQRMRMIQWMLFVNQSETPEQMRPVLEWVDAEVLSGKQPELVRLVVHTFFTALNDHSTFGFEANGGAEHPVFKMLCGSKAISDEMWFPVGKSTFGVTSADRFSRTRAPWAAEVSRRAMEIIREHANQKVSPESDLKLMHATRTLYGYLGRFEREEIGISAEELQGTIDVFLTGLKGGEGGLAGIDVGLFVPGSLANQSSILGYDVRVGVDSHVDIPLLYAVKLAEYAYDAPEYQAWLATRAAELLAKGKLVEPQAAESSRKRGRSISVKASQLIGPSDSDGIELAKICIVMAAVYDSAGETLRGDLRNVTFELQP